MTAPSDTATRKRQRRASKTPSSHVAPPGQRHRVARPAAQPQPAPAKAPVRRSKGRERKRRESAPGTMIQPRSSQLDVVFSARMLSAAILFCLGVVLLLFFQSDAFYVTRIEVGGLNFLAAGEVFALTGAANSHIFWVDPAEVRERVMQSPSVSDVTVMLGWPPHLLQIEVREREPALVWEQAGIRTWIDVRGRVMPQRTDLQGLLRIVVQEVREPLGPNDIIPQDVVDGALQLRELYPTIEVLLYDPVEGLGYQDGRGWRVWFGAGTNMPARLNVYNAIVDDLLARQIQPEYINVGDINAPYYRVWWGREESAPTGGQ